MIEGEKQCRTCGQCKLLSQFSPNSKNTGGYAHHCKSCRRVKANAKNAERIKKSDKPTSWVLPADTRPARDKALDVELRLWPALEPANDLFWRTGA